MRRFFIFIGIVGGLGVGCGGGDGETTCPPDYPILRDGYCYREGDGGLVGFDGGSMTGEDGGVSPDDDGGGGDDDGGAGDVDAQVECSGSHPIVEGGRRFCDPGSCYCGDTAMGLDVCYTADIADACCPVDLECAPATDGGVACMGEHPNVEGGRRFCDPGWCYCGSPSMGLDVCYMAGVADACCAVDVVCE